VREAQGAGIGEGVGFDIDVEASPRGFHGDARISGPSSRCASKSLERSAEFADELRSNVEQRRERKVAFLELGMRDAKTRRLVGAALVPEQVQIHATRTPALVRMPATAETTFGPQQQRKKLGR
jgi:hypothetical protein